jgi:hypothetical protein
MDIVPNSTVFSLQDQYRADIFWIVRELDQQSGLWSCDRLLSYTEEEIDTASFKTNIIEQAILTMCVTNLYPRTLCTPNPFWDEMPIGTFLHLIAGPTSSKRYVRLQVVQGVDAFGDAGHVGLPVAIVGNWCKSTRPHWDDNGQFAMSEQARLIVTSEAVRPARPTQTYEGHLKTIASLGVSPEQGIADFDPREQPPIDLRPAPLTAGQREALLLRSTMRAIGRCVPHIADGPVAMTFSAALKEIARLSAPYA